MFRPFLILALGSAAPVLADETRQLGAHVHGTGLLNIAAEGGEIAMELRAPGADIVGFEHAPRSDADRAAVAAASETLGRPMALFGVPGDAGCSVVRMSVEMEIEGGDGHDHGHDHGHDGGHEHNHGHDHGHDHGDHSHDHDDHDHAAEATHGEFHASYSLTCTDIGALSALSAAGYFDAFPGAARLEVQVVGPAGAAGRAITADAPVIAMGGLL